MDYKGYHIQTRRMDHEGDVVLNHIYYCIGRWMDGL